MDQCWVYLYMDCLFTTDSVRLCFWGSLRSANCQQRGSVVMGLAAGHLWFSGFDLPRALRTRLGMNERVKPLQLKFHDSFPFQLRTFPLYLASAPPSRPKSCLTKALLLELLLCLLFCLFSCYPLLEPPKHTSCPNKTHLSWFNSWILWGVYGCLYIYI